MTRHSSGPTCEESLKIPASGGGGSHGGLIWRAIEESQS